MFVIPLRIDSADPPQLIANLQWMDFDDDDRWREIATAVRKRRHTRLFMISAVSALLFAAAAFWWNNSQHSVWPGPQQVGITLFKLRPSTPQDPARVECGGTFTPVKVALNHVFQAGDRVRVQVKAHQKAFLYVFDEEIGSGGNASVIFPHENGAGNEIVPHTVIDLPVVNCWLIQAPQQETRSTYQGERLTIVLTPKRLAGVTPGPHGIVSNATLRQWETQWASQMQQTMEPGVIGQAESAQELEAGKGAKVLVDPTNKPQTMFTLSASGNTPILLSVSLSVKRKALSPGP